MFGDSRCMQNGYPYEPSKTNYSMCTYHCSAVMQGKYNENQELFTNVVGFKEAIISLPSTNVTWLLDNLSVAHLSLSTARRLVALCDIPP